MRRSTTIPTFEGLDQVVGIHLGEVAEAAGVHAQDRHVVDGDELRRPQHGAVATETEADVEAFAERGFGDGQVRSFDELGVGSRQAGNDVVAAPLDGPMGKLPNLGTV